MNAIEIRICNWLLKLRPAFLAAFIKRIIFIKREKLKTQYGIFFVDPCSNFGHILFSRRIHEPNMIKKIKKYLHPENIFIDLGANEGYFSIISSNIVGENGRVFAVEPQYRLKRVIEKNLELNNCKNITILQLAVTDKNEDAVLYLCPDLNTGGSSLKRTTIYPLRKQKVKSVTLSEIFRQEKIRKCHLLKVDIEGGEFEAILGSPELFKEQRIKAIALELHPEYLEKRNLSGEKITNFLFSCGYNTDGNGIFFIR